MTTILVLDRVIERATIVVLCDHARGLLERADAGTLTCDVSDLTHPDAVAIEALARLQLTARRLQRRIEVRGACEQLRLLLNLAGLRDVIAVADASGVEALGQPEEREQVHRVEEEADPGDAIA